MQEAQTAAGPLPLQTIAMAVVLLTWTALGLLVVAQARHGRGASRRRDTASWIGMGMQGVGFGLVFNVRHRWSGASAAGVVRFAATLLLSALALLLVWWAFRELGRQWSLTARVLTDHRLITTGPYALVRHPIYTGFLALQIATGAALSTPAITALASVVYVVGTLLRTSREERLLRETFGDEHEAYARRVPALLPRLTMTGGARPRGTHIDGGSHGS